MQLSPTYAPRCCRLWPTQTDALAVAVVMHGRHPGPYETPFGIIQPTGADVQIRTIDVLTLTDEKISAVWVNADDLGTLRQLGWRPVAAEDGCPNSSVAGSLQTDPVRSIREPKRCPNPTPGSQDHL